MSATEAAQGRLFDDVPVTTIEIGLQGAAGVDEEDVADLRMGDTVTLRVKAQVHQHRYAYDSEDAVVAERVVLRVLEVDLA